MQKVKKSVIKRVNECQESDCWIADEDEEVEWKLVSRNRSFSTTLSC